MPLFKKLLNNSAVQRRAFLGKWTSGPGGSPGTMEPLSFVEDFLSPAWKGATFLPKTAVKGAAKGAWGHKKMAAGMIGGNLLGGIAGSAVADIAGVDDGAWQISGAGAAIGTIAGGVLGGASGVLWKGAKKTGNWFARHQGVGRGLVTAGAGVAGAGAIAGGLAYGLVQEPIESGMLTYNLDIHSGPAAAWLSGGGLGGGQIAMRAAMAARQRQGMTNMSGADYVTGLSKTTGGSGPMLFSPIGYEKPIKTQDMGVSGDLTLALSNLRRGR